ncbi:MAG TPA: hypothetical protein PLV25_05350, partial [Opitutales bacterium]|nr:hypothetical protein [Opitutales bacterium]
MPIDHTSHSASSRASTQSSVEQLGSDRVFEFDDNQQVVSVAPRFVDRVVDYMPKWLSGGTLERWLLRIGLDKASFQA